MNILVWDTYLQPEDGKEMYFNILVPQEFNEHTKVFEYGNEYLKTKPFKTKKMTTNEFQSCLIKLAIQEIEGSIIA